MQITTKKLAQLRQTLLDAGEVNHDALQEQFKITRPELDEFLIALAKEYPDEFDGVDSAPATVEYKLKDENNILHDLEVFRERDNLIVLQRKLPKDLVTIIVRGEAVEIDLYRLRQMRPDEVQHGVTVARLIELGEAAKG